MNELIINIQNNFGIDKLSTKFVFSNTNKVNVVYAKNGLMKTSFAKIFNKIQEGKETEIKDEIFGKTPIETNIKIDGTPITKNDVFVINSFDSFYESSSIATLLINDSIKVILDEVLAIKDRFFKILEKKSDLKISKTLAGKTVYELENQILDDFSFTEKSFLQNIASIIIDTANLISPEIIYNDIFDNTVIKKIETAEFQTKIDDYLTKSDEIYAKYVFFDKGKFTLPKLKEVQKRLKANNFFVKDNKIVLQGLITDESILTNKITEIETALQATSEFKAIEKLLSDSKGIVLKDIIESYPEIISELKTVNHSNLRKKLWLSYINSEIGDFNVLKDKYLALKTRIDSLDINDTLWKTAINIFNNRFSLPFRMRIDNLTSSIIGESLPKVVFSFCPKSNIDECIDSDWISINRDELEKRDTLSQGEKRALYLLNIIFDIQKRKKNHQKTLFIIDDIADSFDYKNKYAIVEYLKDISEFPDFYLIILSHNFDFYRTISSRLNVGRVNKFHAIKGLNELKIVQEHYQKQPFNAWKDNMKANTKYNEIEVKKHILSLIPFVRNLIEYGVDKKINEFPGITEDFLFLTNLLHIKDQTKNITFGQLKKVYKQYIGKDNFDLSINDNDKVYSLILDIADNHISIDDLKLENKIIFAIAIRLKAEEFMIKTINTSTAIFNWKENGILKNGNNTEFLNFVANEINQTINLFQGFCQIGVRATIEILESVNIMTPENIHLNSFMYEPILDMDNIELKKLYDRVTGLLSV